MTLSQLISSTATTLHRGRLVWLAMQRAVLGLDEARHKSETAELRLRLYITGKRIEALTPHLRPHHGLPRSTE